MFELRKNVTIDLSHLIGKISLSYEYDVMDENNVYEHRTIININDDQYHCYYLNDGHMIMKFNDEYYFFKLRYTSSPSSQDEYDTIIGNLSDNELGFDDDLGTFNFKSLTGQDLMYGKEYVKESIDDSEVDMESEILLKIYECENENEFMLAEVAEGELLMYIGVKLNKGQIL